tara:strand:+ start:301 stop:597 length:297 start_codon:yes stop_codon:yes gene_type:complete
MGKRNKRARTILKRMSMLGEVPSLDTARRYGIEKQVQAEIDKHEAAAAEERRIAEEAERKEREALEAKKKAEAARKRKEAAAKKKVAAAKAKKQSPKE